MIIRRFKSRYLVKALLINLKRMRRDDLYAFLEVRVTGRNIYLLGQEDLRPDAILEEILKAGEPVTDPTETYDALEVYRGAGLVRFQAGGNQWVTQEPPPFAWRLPREHP